MGSSTQQLAPRFTAVGRRGREPAGCGTLGKGGVFGLSGGSPGCYRPAPAKGPPPMYKLLLCWRYLRTRWIALASVISVTLGVATMIVVNAVMAGFSQRDADPDPRHPLRPRVREPLALGLPGSRLAHGGDPPGRRRRRSPAMTPTVAVPAMLNFQVRGQWITRQVMLIGIDEATHASVSDFGRYLQHPANRRQLSFSLREGGYDTIDSQAGGSEPTRPGPRRGRLAAPADAGRAGTALAGAARGRAGRRSPGRPPRPIRASAGNPSGRWISRSTPCSPRRASPRPARPPAGDDAATAGRRLDPFRQARPERGHAGWIRPPSSSPASCPASAWRASATPTGIDRFLVLPATT